MANFDSTLRLYLSTDASEARYLILTNKNRLDLCSFYEFSVREGEAIKKRIGFNPMTSITFRQRPTKAELDTIIGLFQDRDIFVAVEENDIVKQNNCPLPVSHFVVNRRKAHWGESAKEVMFNYDGSKKEERRY